MPGLPNSHFQTHLQSHRLSLENIREAARVIDPVFLHSPQFSCEPLGAILNCDVTLKVETLNPIRSFKGRGADYFVRKLSERGAVPGLVCASAGNFGQALAYACRRRKISLVVYAARNANALKVERMRGLGAEVRLDGSDFDDAKSIARSWAASAGMALVEDGREAEISEGAGTIAVELLARTSALDAIVVPLGNGALLTGMARWTKAEAPSTRVIGVVSAGATSMQASWQRGPGGGIVTHPRTDTIADGIAVREPIAEAVADMYGLVDDVVAVDDAAIIRAMRLLHEHAGVVVEPAGAAGLAAITGQFAGQRVATVLCGGNLTPAQMSAWLAAKTSN
ncbi:MAG: pyridoxal-phosphate dependent enzyme [Betaproteobacteria bacterium]